MCYVHQDFIVHLIMVPSLMETDPGTSEKSLRMDSHMPNGRMDGHAPFKDAGTWVGLP